MHPMTPADHLIAMIKNHGHDAWFRPDGLITAVSEDYQDTLDPRLADARAWLSYETP